jgi:hypothetical protein
MNEDEITRDEFWKYLEENLKPWLANRKRPLVAHLLALEDWATTEFNREARAVEKKKKEKGGDNPIRTT